MAFPRSADSVIISSVGFSDMDRLQNCYYAVDRIGRSGADLIVVRKVVVRKDVLELSIVHEFY